MAHQRGEVLHFWSRRPTLQDIDLHAANKPGWTATRQAFTNTRADGHPRGRNPWAYGSIWRRRCASRSHALAFHRRACASKQVRLGPGRIHHCMRSIGAAERALELMIQRGLSREAFGKPIARLGKNTEVIAKARIEIEAMRLMVLRAAKAMDTLGNAEARIWVSAVKAMVPERVCKIIDEAIQVFGGAGVSQWTPLARMYAGQRTLRLADGPDEVHWHVVGRAEIARYEGETFAPMKGE
jgi:uncharacterized glyoxalase superfamily protein PhnB